MMEDYKDQVSENGFRLWKLQQEIKKHVKEEMIKYRIRKYQIRKLHD